MVRRSYLNIVRLSSFSEALVKLDEASQEILAVVTVLNELHGHSEGVAQHSFFIILKKIACPLCSIDLETICMSQSYGFFDCFFEHVQPDGFHGNAQSLLKLFVPEATLEHPVDDVLLARIDLGVFLSQVLLFTLSVRIEQLATSGVGVDTTG
jgi:hypothetical protein